MKVQNLYSKRAEERRKQFNNIIRGIDMVLMNNIPEVDESVYDNWQGESPMRQDCETEQISKDGEDDGLTWFHCLTHDMDTLDEYSCEEYENDDEVYQWFAVGDSDAEFLKRHGQYITYSDLLDTYFLAITHCGTSWDYVDSMVEAFSDCYTGLENFTDEKKQ